jgi:cytochrome P450
VIDLLDPALHARGEADAVLDALRDESPIAWRDGRRGPGYWAVTGYAELVAIARDPAAFTSHWGTRPEVRRTVDAARPLHNIDPPAHTELRALANRLVAQAARGDDGVIAAAIDAFAAAGGGDAMPALATAIPAELFAQWIGFGAAAGARLAECVERVHSAGAAHLDDLAAAVHRDAARAATEELHAWIATAADPPPGSVLAALRELPLARDAATMLVALLVEAGLPTVIDAIGNGLALLTSPPADIALAVDEVLRLRSPIQQFARYATRDAGPIRAGDQVILWFGAANRDPREFPDPHAFQLREPNRHLAFGAGPHRCLGARFARDLLARFFTAWFARVPSHTARGVRRASSYMCGYRELRLQI